MVPTCFNYFTSSSYAFWSLFNCYLLNIWHLVFVIVYSWFNITSILTVTMVTEFMIEVMDYFRNRWQNQIGRRCISIRNRCRFHRIHDRQEIATRGHSRAWPQWPQTAGRICKVFCSFQDISVYLASFWNVNDVIWADILHHIT